MSTPPPPLPSPTSPPPLRWTAERQCRFLSHLAHSRCATRAARACGMSRESAYRLRRREPGGLFDLLWNDIMTRRSVRVTAGNLRRDPPRHPQ